MTYREQIEEIIRENGWEGRFALETESATGEPERILVKLAPPLPPGADADGVVNVYTDGVHPPEQVQQECLRALRTGRPGI